MKEREKHTIFPNANSTKISAADVHISLNFLLSLAPHATV
jgi:hypothetical protein